MIHIHHRFHANNLARIFSAATAGLVIVTMVAIARTPHGDEAYALSKSAGTVATSSMSSSKTSNPVTSGTTSQSTSATPGSKQINTSSAVSSTSQETATTGANAARTLKQLPNPTPAPGAAANAIRTTATAPAGTWKYQLHGGIRTTYFYAGEPATADNDFIQNASSAWQDNWQNYFGGSDNPASRCGYNPCAFSPKENPFYFALPFSDYTSIGPVADLSMVPWKPAGNMVDGTSILKNRWIQITAAPNGTAKTVYAQWEDVGPFNEHDSAYVFGSAAPASTRAGLDVSPATRDYLGMGGDTISSWRFVDYSEVPSGPWNTTITSSAPDWN